jgi:D-alanine-D-alanine ligase
MSKKINLHLLFGGKSAEHDVSVQSAKNVYDALDKDKYDVSLIGIDKSGRWHSLSQIESPRTNILDSQSSARDIVTNLITQNALKNDTSLHVFFPLLHGPNGEDGTIQGLLKLADVPFVGASVLGSAIGMDKDVSKRLLRDKNIPVVKFITLQKNDASVSFDKITSQLGLPLFVKPANLGSSVGVSKVSSEKEYKKALTDAFSYDHKILIEEAIKGRELECSVMGNESPRASIVGEIIPQYEFYDYDSKYIDEKGATLEVPAKISEKQSGEIQYLAVKAFKTLCCEGMARVDFFLADDGLVYVNEINTIPGFTKISVYPKLWEASGIGFTELIDRLVALAIERYKRDAALKSTRH